MPPYHLSKNYPMEIKMPPNYKTQWLFLPSSSSLFDCIPPCNLDIPPQDQPSGILWAQGFWAQHLEPKLKGGKSWTCSWKRKKTKGAKYREEWMSSWMQASARFWRPWCTRLRKWNRSVRRAHLHFKKYWPAACRANMPWQECAWKQENHIGTWIAAVQERGDGGLDQMATMERQRKGDSLSHSP